MTGLVVSAEVPADAPAIRGVHEACFPTSAEAELVEKLQADGDAVLSLVGRYHGAVAGHVLFSRVKAVESRGLRVTALGPVAVVPAQKRSGIGSALIREGLNRLERDGEDLVLVLGDPKYYARFGFSIEAAQVFQTPYDGPFLQALALSQAGRRAWGPLRYARAFAALA